MKYIKKAAKFLVAMLAGALYGLAVCAGVQWLMQSVAYGLVTPWSVWILCAVLGISSIVLAALEK